MSQEKLRIDFQCFARLPFRFVEPSGTKISPREIGVDDGRQWIELEGAFSFLNCLVQVTE